MELILFVTHCTEIKFTGFSKKNWPQAASSHHLKFQEWHNDLRLIILRLTKLIVKSPMEV